MLIENLHDLIDQHADRHRCARRRLGRERQLDAEMRFDLEHHQRQIERSNAEIIDAGIRLQTIAVDLGLARDDVENHADARVGIRHGIHDGHHRGVSTPPKTNCRILIVEDEATIARNCVTFLELRGYPIDIAHDGAAAITLLTSDTFDVVVLDLGLPRIDGKRVLDHMRRQLGLATPVLILTARDELDSKLACFELGADDYLAKPFSLAELEARVAALHRRASGSVVMNVAAIGTLRLDRRTRSVSVRGQSVHLPPRPMRILECLLLDAGRVVSRSELEALLWPDGERDSDVLRSQIHLLRRALSEAGYDGLETVHGVGYRLRTEGVSQ